MPRRTSPSRRCACSTTTCAPPTPRSFAWDRTRSLILLCRSSSTILCLRRTQRSGSLCDRRTTRLLPSTFASISPRFGLNSLHDKFQPWPMQQQPLLRLLLLCLQQLPLLLLRHASLHPVPNPRPMGYLIPFAFGAFGLGINAAIARNPPCNAVSVELIITAPSALGNRTST